MRFVLVLLLVPLVAGSLAWGQETSDIAALKAEYQAAVKEWRQAYQEARQQRLPRSKWPKHPAIAFFPRFKAAVLEAPEGSEEAGEGLVWMMQNIRTVDRSYASALKKQRKLAEKLIAHHADQKCMRAVPQLFSRVSRDQRAKALEVLGTILARNQHPEVRGPALFAKASCLAGKYMEPTRAELGTARDCLKTLLEKYPESSVAKRARPLMFELSHLQIGMTAPDFEAQDVDGVTFKLSDYRGKVVVLDFWGFW